MAKSYKKITNIAQLFKPYIVTRKNGQCQVLIPLVELDELCDKIESWLREKVAYEEGIIYDSRGKNRGNNLEEMDRIQKGEIFVGSLPDSDKEEITDRDLSGMVERDIKRRNRDIKGGK